MSCGEYPSSPSSARESSPMAGGGASGSAVKPSKTTACRNDRRIPVAGGGHVRNGALWQVTATHADGSLTLTPADKAGPESTASEARTEVTLPAHYVAEHVELGYATTIHRAQGLTVDHAHVLASAGMSREALYVGMTRGRTSNHVYVSTDTVDPMCDDLPDPGTVATGREILQRILTADGTELSATQTLRRRQDSAAALATLEPIRTTLHADADVRRWQRLLPSCGFSEAQARHGIGVEDGETFEGFQEN